MFDDYKLDGNFPGIRKVQSVLPSEYLISYLLTMLYPVPFVLQIVCGWIRIEEQFDARESKRAWECDGDQTTQRNSDVLGYSTC